MKYLTQSKNCIVLYNILLDICIEYIASFKIFPHSYISCYNAPIIINKIYHKRIIEFINFTECVIHYNV